MEEQDLVSIIVPVYNAENYLQETLTGILNQCYSNLELILINDGSTDNSKIICDEIGISDSRVKVIHQKNSGPSVARNKGIEVSSGKYIQFIDADDTVDKNMISKLVENIKSNVDLVICGYTSVLFTKGELERKIDFKYIEGDYDSEVFLDVFGDLFYHNMINPLWNKLYDSALIKHNNIRFNENINMGEDLLFNLEYIDASERIKIINDLLYNYVVVNTNSLTGNFKKRYFDNQQMLFHSVREFLKSHNKYDNENKDYVELYYSNSIIGCINNLFHKNSDYSSKDIRTEIHRIISNDCVRENISYFKIGSKQKKVIGYLIHYKLTRILFDFHKIKSIIRKIIS